MKKLVAILITLIIIGCSKETQINSFALSSGVRFNILNNEGEDLLNANNANYYSVDNMKLYYEINGEIVEVYDENMNLPRNIGLITETSPYQIGFASYSGYEGEISEIDGVKRGVSINYLELNNNDIDTIKVEWESKKDHYFVNRKIFYNGKEFNHDNMPFTIIK